MKAHKVQSIVFVLLISILTILLANSFYHRKARLHKAYEDKDYRVIRLTGGDHAEAYDRYTYSISVTRKDLFWLESDTLRVTKKLIIKD